MTAYGDYAVQIAAITQAHEVNFDDLALNTSIKNILHTF